HPAVKHIRICKRPDQSGAFRQTLVVETDIPQPPHQASETENFASLMNDIHGLQELARGGFVGFEKVEISGANWRTVLH
ncbi:MAG: hypothetical protein KKA05_01150, partial [Alphaproteobacteria bacterium]|nr:hypothetical protein [Alphaproteobacteria bacterium]